MPPRTATALLGAVLLAATLGTAGTPRVDAAPVAVSQPQTSTAAAPKARDDRPNIVLITSDDQADTDLAYMPRTRELLAEQGVEFTDGINPHPLCCPARAEIMTGKYAQNNGVHANSGRWGGYRSFLRGGNEDAQIGAWLHDAGYRTAMVGKTLNGYRTRLPTPSGWDYWSPMTRKVYSYYGTTFDNNGSPQTYDDEYVADVVRDQSVDLVRQWSGSKPFFIWASHVGPHAAEGADAAGRADLDDPLSPRVGVRSTPIPAERHRGMFEGVTAPSRGSGAFDERDVSDKPRPIRQLFRSRADGIDRHFQLRIESLQAIDEANAAMVQALADAGELDDTLIVYVSDNGWQYGEHGLIGKNFPYRENLQIPFLMRLPHATRARQSTATASLVDLAPTFLDYAGVLRKIRHREHVDGLSLRDVLRRGTPNETTLVQAGAKKRPWLFRGVRTSRYTWVTWNGEHAELYDHRTDPDELDNLLRPETGRLVDRAYAPVLAELKRRYQALKDCSGVLACESRRFGPEPTPRRDAEDAEDAEDGGAPAGERVR